MDNIFTEKANQANDFILIGQQLTGGKKKSKRKNRGVVLTLISDNSILEIKLKSYKQPL